MEKIAVIPVNGARVRRRAYRRVSAPAGPIGVRLLIPLLILLGTALFGVTRFANAWIERTAGENVRAALDAAGHQWAQVAVSGQQVRLTGSAPSAAAGDDALVVARGAECPTWLGPKVCAVSVAGVFGATEAAVGWLDVEGVVQDGRITLNGDVPDEATRDAVVEEARGAVATGRVRDVVDRLQVVGREAPADFEDLAGLVAEVSGLCRAGRAALTNGSLSVRCEVTRAAEPRIRSLLEVPLAAGSAGPIELVVVEDAAACEANLASLQATARIEFATGSADIVPTAGPLLEEIAAAARACPGTLRIEGHTDNTGNQEANQTLSLARAEAVRDALATRGVASDRMVAVGMGQDQPVASNATAEGRARNRRIEFRVTLPSN